jgi:hypothetical protein
MVFKKVNKDVDATDTSYDIVDYNSAYDIRYVFNVLTRALYFRKGSLQFLSFRAIFLFHHHLFYLLICF